nr:M56 family metallopeptidase [uncultured Dyadobacter sp.]
MISYLIKCIVCSGILLAVYHVWLERDKMLRFNRFYLLAAMVFSLVVPFAAIEMPSQQVPEALANPPVLQELPGFMSSEALHSEVPVRASELPDYLPWLFYGLVSTALLLRLLFMILSIVRSKTGCKVVALEKAKLILIPGKIASFTFFKAIFLSRDAFEDDSIPKEILAHELAHARQMHSFDIVFTEILIALCWFNPLLLGYRRAIRLNHEFLADESVLTGSTDVRKYQLLILDTLLAHRVSAIASSFNYPFTKKRLAMMTTNSNPRIQLAKKALIALLLPLLAFTFAEKTFSQQPAENSPAKIKATVAPAPESETVSEAGMKEFLATIEQYTTYVKNGKGRTDPMVRMNPELENQLYAVYERMSDAQKAQVSAKEITMFRMKIPVKKAPTPEMFENWKRTDVFGIWLNGKHVPNATLNKYNAADIAEYSLSKLYGGALKGRSYKYQLGIMTNEHFDKTYDERVNNRVVITRRGWFNPKDAPKKAEK